MTKEFFNRINKYTVIIGVIFVALLLAFGLGSQYLKRNGSLLNNNGQENPLPPAITGPELTKWEVEIFDTKYEPNNLTIHKGETVTWTNKGTRANWPASDNHPTHTKYPVPGGCIGSAFDACRGLKPGESYTFQFDRTGVWDYHDHLAPGLVGTIQVEP